jgi:hypothetical protein
MKKHLLVLAVAAFFAMGNAFGQVVGNLDDLNYWGTGSNRSALVVDWNDGKTNETLAWGFRWDGPAPTVGDLLVSLAAADPRLFFRLDSDASFGVALFGVGYQTGGTAFGVTGAQNTLGDSVTPVFVSGVSDMNITNGVTDSPLSSSLAAPLNAADHYAEAWNSPDRYWTLFFSGSGVFPSNADPSYTYPAWTEAGLGLSGASLDDGGWYALSYSDPFWTAVTPGAAVAAVPEPESFALLVFAAGTIFVMARRHRSMTA